MKRFHIKHHNNYGVFGGLCMATNCELVVPDIYVYKYREPLLMDTPYKGHNRKNLHIKDRFNGPK